MAKLGPKEKGGYDPFNAIANSLSALTTEPPAQATPPAPEQAAPAQARQAATPDPEPAPSKPKRRASAPARTTPAATIPAPAEPVVVEAPQPVATPVQDIQGAAGFVGGRAVGGQEAAPPQPAPAKPKTVSPTSALQITKRFKTTRQEASQLDAAAIQLGAALGVSIDFSKLTRALWDVYMRHQEDILRNVPEGEVWERPANNDAAGLAELDERLADLINDGLMVACRRPNNSR